jgi:hypothetical protein
MKDDCKALMRLGSPDVRNAILLNELGALLHDVGKLSDEFISGGDQFSHHLVLRRLTRGCDPDLQDTISSPFGDEARAGELAGTKEDLEWQMEQEKEIAFLQPPFFPSGEFVERLDELPFVADLVEKQARTWHPQELLSPEVRLLRRIHELVDDGDPVPSSTDEGRLSEIRYLLCEVLANQLLEIVNIRKDGPGDLGSWFWNSRLYARSEAGLAALSSFDEGVSLTAQEMELVLWLGVRIIAEWAYRKVKLGNVADVAGRDLWDHCWWLCTLYKSSLSGALIEGVWPDDHVSWSRLRVTVNHSSPEVVEGIKQLVEVEYPLGNELGRTGGGIEFSFPTVTKEIEAALVDCLRAQVVRLLGEETDIELCLAPLQPRARNSYC